MLEHHEFCDHCPGCRPAILDVTTGRALAADSPMMMRVNKIWDKDTTYAQRKAYIEVTVHNSRSPQDMELASVVASKFGRAFE
jgi:hypothetical protein